MPEYAPCMELGNSQIRHGTAGDEFWAPGRLAATTDTANFSAHLVLLLDRFRRKFSALLIRSILRARRWPCAERRKVRRPRTQYAGMSYGLCAGFSVSKSPRARLSSPANAVRRSPRPGLLGCWSGLELRLSWGLRPARTCCGMPAGTHWRTRDTIPGPCKRIWGTRIFSTPYATLSWHRGGLRTSGGSLLPHGTLKT